MYSAEKIRSVHALVLQGLPHREIANMANVSKELVSDVATGKRVAKERIDQPRRGRFQSPYKKAGEPRCPKCGTTGGVPCRLCDIRESGEEPKHTPELLLKQERAERRKLELGQASLAAAGHDPTRCCGVCGLGPIKKIPGKGLTCLSCNSDTAPAPSLAEIRRACIAARAKAIQDNLGRDVKMR